MAIRRSVPAVACRVCHRSAVAEDRPFGRAVRSCACYAIGSGVIDGLASAGVGCVAGILRRLPRPHRSQPALCFLPGRRSLDPNAAAAPASFAPAETLGRPANRRPDEQSTGPYRERCLLGPRRCMSCPRLSGAGPLRAIGEPNADTPGSSWLADHGLGDGRIGTTAPRLASRPVRHFTASIRSRGNLLFARIPILPNRTYRIIHRRRLARVGEPGNRSIPPSQRVPTTSAPTHRPRQVPCLSAHHRRAAAALQNVHFGTAERRNRATSARRPSSRAPGQTDRCCRRGRRDRFGHSTAMTSAFASVPSALMATDARQIGSSSGRRRLLQHRSIAGSHMIGRRCSPGEQPPASSITTSSSSQYLAERHVKSGSPASNAAGSQQIFSPLSCGAPSRSNYRQADNCFARRFRNGWQSSIPACRYPCEHGEHRLVVPRSAMLRR